ncbi:formate--tetrahydrofolate ligase [Kytococcus sedentarius]|uniref:Formate--tetrahydrofolate ligase n=1 Tax=Kytococcus sedentarius (strain ATCC 14392 / DSM 20547 / JCM 11482 / CCUG 33030 / NBRC 15357 / NCTC 11040 / CCM 314 / 541) TaxID=478801 RepID=C7NHH2_KYTSD|nr:formate--tetrahydrofolate ligase [Kytococcus sedentarius]ACV06329.1 Formate-tetrahydrofolate ligase [Kytococcus sedentarius DSM 20547]QQB64657.1 formate--tetrahydrofolate ligase [Kytococcus sedentarius]STX12253.1 Formate--tetrahydrofolate ligase [Kytococcus sedentarius]
MTPLPSDIEIARDAQLRSPLDVAQDMGIDTAQLEPYGHHVAKVDLSTIDQLADRPQAKYVVVTAVTPTPFGEGKTTTAVGLAQGLAKEGHSPVLALRQPSLGPVFGIKGGAAGGGYSQVVPMEVLNLHLTGDFHAVTAAHDLLAAMVSNHLHHGNELGIHTVEWRRVLDINDRALRAIIEGNGGPMDGVTRQSGFDITAASEVMVILALATSLADLRERLGRIVVGWTKAGEPVTAEDLKAAGAMAVLLRDALKPNLLQTLEGTPALIHTGPFGNIATGNSSVVADRIGSRAGDFLVTEAGFAADMGAERFFNVKCRAAGLTPDAAVVVVTVRALKAHSDRFQVKLGKELPAEMLAEGPADVEAGAPNLRKHLSIIRSFGVQPVVAINAFPTDHDSEHEVIRRIATEEGARVAVSTHVAEGGQGARELARVVAEACEEETSFTPTYELSDPLATKIEKIATGVYGADGVSFEPAARRALEQYTERGYGELPVLIAKTQMSLSHDPNLKGAPTGWTLPIREVRLAAGAGYVYALAGSIMTMPGLSKHPGAERIDLDEQGNVVGLF